MIKPTDKVLEFIKSHRVARMATVDGLGRPLVIPVCYHFNGSSIYTPIDKKPKRASPRKLKRVRNIILSQSTFAARAGVLAPASNRQDSLQGPGAEIIESG